MRQGRESCMGRELDATLENWLLPWGLPQASCTGLGKLVNSDFPQVISGDPDFTFPMGRWTKTWIFPFTQGKTRISQFHRETRRFCTSAKSSMQAGRFILQGAGGSRRGCSGRGATCMYMHRATGQPGEQLP